MKLNEVDVENIRKIEGIMSNLGDDALPRLQQVVMDTLVDRYSRCLLGKFFSHFSVDYGKVESDSEK